MVHTLFDLIAWHLGNLEAKGDVFLNIQVGKQRIFLKDRVDAALVGRQVGDVAALKEHGAFRGIFKAADDAQRGRLAAAAGAQQSHKLLSAHIQVDVAQDPRAVKLLGYALEVDEMLLVNHGRVLLRLRMDIKSWAV